MSVYMPSITKEAHILSPNPCPFSMALPHKIQFTYLPTQTMPSFKGSSTDNSHIFPHKPCLLSKALPRITHISSHTNHALFQRLFHRKVTHPLTQHMSVYMSSFNETNAAYVKELPSLCRIKPGYGWDSLCYINCGFT